MAESYSKETAEGDYVVGYNNFDKQFTEDTETWIFKEVPLPGFVTGLNPNMDNG